MSVSTLSRFLADRAITMLGSVSPAVVGETLALWAKAHLVESDEYAEVAAVLAQRGVTLPTAAQAGAIHATRVEKTVTANGEYAAIDDDAYGYSDVTVAIAHPTKTITENGTYLASDDGCAGWGQVNVDTVAYTIVTLPTSTSTDASMTITSQAEVTT